MNMVWKHSTLLVANVLYSETIELFSTRYGLLRRQWGETAQEMHGTEGSVEMHCPSQMHFTRNQYSVNNSKNLCLYRRVRQNSLL